LKDGKLAPSAGGATRLSSPNKAEGGVEEPGVISTSDFGRNSGKALASIFCWDLASSSLNGWPASDLIIYMNLHFTKEQEKIRTPTNSFPVT
jgi:hypothetical protein